MDMVEGDEEVKSYFDGNWGKVSYLVLWKIL